MLRALALLAMTLNLAPLTSCRPEPVPGDSDGRPFPDGEARETSVPDATLGNACPAPKRLGLADIPTGYLPPVKVTIADVADGDSGRYSFPSAQNQGVRLLYVNTEESFGAEMTAFGVQTKGIVIQWINEAKEVQIAVRESFKGSKKPDNDPYDRWLSLMFLDGELLQTRLVREGLTAYYTVFGCAPDPIHEALLHAEAEANTNKRGIWGPGPHNDYRVTLEEWIGTRTCRPNPFKGPYCR